MPGEGGVIYFVFTPGRGRNFSPGEGVSGSGEGVERGSGEGASFISRLVYDFIIIFFVFSPSFKRYIYI